MRTSLSVLKVCVAVAVLALAADAMAQGQGGGGRRGGFGGRGGFAANPLMLLQAEPIQKELDLSDDQKTSISKLAEENRPGGGGGGGGGQMTQEERQTRRDELTKKVNDVLLPNQQERLAEITLQLQGAQALSDPKVADKLQLTDDQKKQLADLSTDYRQKTRDLFGGGGPPDADAMSKLRTDETDKAMAILTSDQKDQFTKMEGKKIDIDPMQLFRGGRRNRGNGNGGNGGKAQPDA
jgi:hypothetical protein